MKRSCSPLITGLLGSLLAGSIAAACGSDTIHKNARPEGGGEAGIGGVGGDFGASGGGMSSAPGGAGGVPQPMAGAGGEPSAGGLPAGGVGGVATEAGAGGASDTLPPLDCTTIVFPDSGLEKAVRETIGKLTGDLTPADVATLETLYANGYGIQALDGIGCLPALSTLNLGIGGQANNVSDLAPLLYLDKLKTLYLNDNPLGDLTPLGKLPSLQTLELNDSLKGNDLTPLANAKGLTGLSMANDTLGDLTPISKLPALAKLVLQYSILDNQASVATLKNVDELVASGAVDDAAVLKGLTQLKTLYVSNKPLKNPAGLGSLVNLVYLDATNTELTSAAPFAKLTKLQSLYLDYDKISDLTPLAGLTSLRTLSLMNNTFTDIQPLVDNTGLGMGASIWLTGINLSCMTEGAKLKVITDRGASVYGFSCP